MAAVGLVAAAAVAGAQQDTVPPVLDTVIVTVDRSRSPAASVPHAHTVMEGPKLVAGRTTDGLDDVLLGVAGVQVSNRYNYAQDQRLSIRGFGARSAFGVRGVKVLLDGIPQTLADGQSQLTNFEPGDVQRIELWRGVGSSLYGNAAGGVLALETRAAIAGPTAAARATGGAYGFRKGAVRAALPVGHGALALTGSWTSSEGFRQHSAARFARVGARYDVPVGAGDLTVTARYADMPEALNPGALTAEEMARDPTLAAPRNVAAGAYKSVWQAQVGARLRHRLSSAVRGEFTAHGTRRRLDNGLTFGSIDLDRWAGGVRAAVTGDRAPLRVTAGVDVDWQQDDRQNRDAGSNAVSLDQLEHVTAVGPFVQVVIAPRFPVRFRAGARYDRVAFDVDDRFLADGDASGTRVLQAVTWSTGILWQAHPAATPFANVGTAFETPTTTELVNRPDGSGGLNPLLEPQQATQVEGGVRGRVGPARYEAVVFRTDVRDAVVPFQDSTVPDRQYYRNAGRVRHQGIELTGQVTAVSALQLEASYGFGDYVFREFSTVDGDFSGNRVPGVARHQVGAAVDVRSTAGVWATGEYQYLSGIPVDDANTAEAPDRSLVNLRVGWDGTVGGVQLRGSASVLNLLDAAYAGSVVVNARAGRYYEPAPGRNLLVAVTLAF